MNAFKIIDNAEKVIGKTTKKRIVISKKNNSKITLDEIKKVGHLFIDGVQKKHNKDAKLIIRGMSNLGVRTLKGYDEDINKMHNDDEEYLKGRVKETTKFQDFTQVEITFCY